MTTDIVVGCQYGDEGKAKATDQLAADYDVVARFNGGPNAGHTVSTSRGTIALHQIPSAIFNEDTLLYVGSGCVLNLEKLVDELEEVAKFGIDLTGRLHLSSQISLIQPRHIMIDCAEGGRIATTGNGIGPCYADRAQRMQAGHLVNIRLGDLVDDYALAMAEIRANAIATAEAYGLDVDIDKAVQDLAAAIDLTEGYIQRDTLCLAKLVEEGTDVLFEGAQSFMLDPVNGSVPYVTSGATVAGAAYVGGDVPPNFHGTTYGVAKVIMSRVGNGPFVSEFGGDRSEEYCMVDGGKAHTKEYETANYDIGAMLASDDPFEVGIALRVLGGEYGATTKRPRRIGMFDLVQLRQAVIKSGIDELVLTKCDLLKDFASTGMPGIPVVTGYRLDGEEIDYVPTSNAAHRRVQPVVQCLPAFSDDISGVRDISHLPSELLDFVSFVGSAADCNVMGIGVGPKREQYVRLY